MAIRLKTVSSPPLVSGGAFFVNFGQFSKINGVSVTSDLAAKLNSGIVALSGYLLQAYPQIVSLVSGQASMSGQPIILSGYQVVASGVGFTIVSGQGNYVRVGIEKTPLAISSTLQVAPVPAFAVSGDVIGNTFNILVDGD
jgi:hypothetical protein